MIRIALGSIAAVLVLLSGTRDALPAAAPRIANVNLNLFEGDCNVYGPKRVICYKREDGRASGAGSAWGQWFFISSGTAPGGYQLERTEFHGHADNPHGDLHRCGGTDDSPPVNGFKQGTSYWFQCIMIERDATHAKWQYSIQGVGGRDVLYGQAELLSIWLQVP
jgi:hypothetical protein